MELNFTGRGAMLYPKEGNTAAYVEDDKSFFLIDCGEDVASKLIEQGKLNQDKDYYLLVTHTHSDHIGSLGTLQQYLYWCCGKKLNIVVSEEMGYLKELNDVIRAFGLESNSYKLVDVSELSSELFLSIEYVPSNHGDVPIKSCSIVFDTSRGRVLYTGDIADTVVIESFIEIGNIDKMYVDTSLNRSPVHLGIDDLRSVIPDSLKEKIYCMHINSRELIPLIDKYGFNLAQVSGNKES